MSLKALLTGELTLGLRIRSALVQRNYATILGAPKDETIDITSVDRHPKYADDSEEFDEEFEIELKRNKSRLNPSHHNILNGQRPYDTPMAIHHHGLDFKRRMLGRFGIEGSGVPPGVAWPTKEAISELKEYEKTLYPLSLKESWAQIAEKHAVEEAKIQAREDDVAAKLAKTRQWENELNAKLLKKEREMKAAKQRKERLVEEVRRHFGFKVDPKDERFKEMIEQKEKEDKKRKKAERKKEREDQMMGRLLEGSTMEGSPGANKAGKSKTTVSKNLA